VLEAIRTSDDRDRIRRAADCRQTAAVPLDETLAVAVQRAYGAISAGVGPERVHHLISLVVTVPVPAPGGDLSNPLPSGDG
jgi:hypothetical protein